MYFSRFINIFIIISLAVFFGALFLFFQSVEALVPVAPTLNEPANLATGISIKPTFKMTATDPESDDIQYKIQLASEGTCTVILQTFDQSSSQTGWSWQDSGAGARYKSGTQGVYDVQIPLAPNTAYYWRAAAKDPLGDNAWGAWSGCNSFTTKASKDYTETLEFFVVQEAAQHISGDQINSPFAVYIGDDIRDLKSGFFEIKGVLSPTAGATMQVSIDDATFAQARAKSFELSSQNKATPFNIEYDATTYLDGIITKAGTYNFTLNIKITGGTVSVLSAKLILTYSHRKPPEPPSSAPYPACFPATPCALESSTFDTQSANGAAYNSLIWKGTEPVGTDVRLQLATSSNSNGPWTFLGSSCTEASYYSPAADTPVEIKCYSNHNNKRYFRYKIFLDTNAAQDQTPTVTDVVVNYSP